jgi:hypothetical protein
MAVLVEVAIETGGTEAEETMLLVVSSMIEDEEDDEAVDEAIWVEVTTARVSLVGDAITVEVASTTFQIRLNEQGTRDYHYQTHRITHQGEQKSKRSQRSSDLPPSPSRHQPQ